MDCTLDHYLIEGYLDGELGFERTLDVEAHLASCANCTQEVQGWKSVREALQQPEMYFRASGALERKVRAAIPVTERSEAKKSAGREGVSWMSRWLWAGGGAAFATAAMVMAFFVLRPATGPTFFAAAEEQELVASHVRSLVGNHLMDVVSTDQHTVKPWFDGKLDFAPPVRDLAEQGYPLAGGRLDYIEGRTVATMIYHRALHPINLYVWPASGDAAMRVETIRGYNVVSWSKGGFAWRAVSDLNTEELQDFARKISE
jgi:anti-sigma factor RsiW